MTFIEARTHRRAYLATGGFALVLGALIPLVTALKGLYIVADRQGGFGAYQIEATVGWIYQNGMIVSWLWPWMSDTGFGGTFNIFSPSGLLGFTFIGVSAFSFTNAARLKRWITEVRELLAKEEMAASRRSPSSRQSVGDVQAGRDSHITQQITNHYNHRPDNPKVPIIAAIIGALAVIAAAFLRNS
jgi:hypothetical protein